MICAICGETNPYEKVNYSLKKVKKLLILAGNVNSDIDCGEKISDERILGSSSVSVGKI